MRRIFLVCLMAIGSATSISAQATNKFSILALNPTPQFEAGTQRTVN